MKFIVDAAELLRKTKHLSNEDFGLLLRTRLEIVRDYDKGESDSLTTAYVHGSLPDSIICNGSPLDSPHLLTVLDAYTIYCKRDSDYALGVTKKRRASAAVRWSAKKAPKVRITKKSPDEEAIKASWDLFERYWVAYGKKGNRKVAFRAFYAAGIHAMDSAKEIGIRRHVVEYVRSTPDRTYRKNFETYIKQAHWENPIESPVPDQTARPALSAPEGYRPV